MKKIKLLFEYVFSCSLFFCAFLTTNCNSQNIQLFGFNGHPLTQGAYKNNIEEQYKALASLHANIYRVDIPIDKKGFIYNDNAFSELMEMNKAYPKIKILPVLLPREELTDKSLNECYMNGYNIASKFIHRYKTYFSVFSNFIEVGNELDTKVILGAEYSGENITHYETNHLEQFVYYYKGFIDAIKEGEKYKKIVINIAYVHLGFLEALKKADVNYDIIGLHWYSNMRNIFSFGVKKINVINEIHTKFNKNILVDEFNIHTGVEFNIINKKNLKWMEKNINYLKKNPYCIGVVYYELFDEPDFATKGTYKFYNPAEANYGFFYLKKPNL